MKSLRACLLVATVSAVFTIAGCPQPGPSPSVVTDGQKAAINSIIAQLSAAVQGFTTLHRLTDNNLDLDQLPSGSGIIGASTTCPGGSFVYSATDLQGSFDFGDGCSTQYTAGNTIVGALSIAVTRADNTADIEFVNSHSTIPDFTIGGTGASGTMQAVISNTATGVSLDITANVVVDGITTITGTFRLNINDDGTLTLVSGTMTLNDGTNSYAITLDGIAADPAGLDSVAPYDGSFSFTYSDGTDTNAVTVTATTNTPTTGTVQVSVDGGSAVDHTVP